MNTIRSINIKRIIKERLSDKVQFCKPTCESKSYWIQSEYLLSADENILPDPINAILTLYAIESCCLFSIIRYWKSWENILESTELLELDKRLFNLIAWIVTPIAAMGKNGFVQLSGRKIATVSEIVQNILKFNPW